MLPVRSSGPIPKEKLFAAIDSVKLITITSPVKAGTVITPDFLWLGRTWWPAGEWGRHEAFRLCPGVLLSSSLLPRSAEGD